MSVDQFLLSADTTDLNYPEIRPTLDLNFARVKALDPRITFTRSSGGSYVGADGLIKYAGVNEARFDHDPETGESLGLLIEESRSNLLTRSEAFDDSSWLKEGLSVSSNLSNIVAPDGTLTSEKLIENTENRQHFIYKSRSGSNETVTFSVFAKAAERTQCLLQLSNFQTNACSATYDLQSGRVIFTFIPTGDYINISSSIIPYPNGWYRCILTATKQSVNTTNTPTISTVRTNSASYPGDGTSGVYLWGAQLEQGAFPTSYIPTQASTRTRAVDSASITGKNFSEWYRQDEGTIYANTFRTPKIPSNFAGFSDGTLNNRINFRHDTSGDTVTAIMINSGVLIAAAFANVISNNLKFVYSQDINNVVVSGNGTIGETFNFEVLFPIVNRLDIGTVANAGRYNGTISRLTYFPKRLPNAQLQALTR